MATLGGAIAERLAAPDGSGKARTRGRFEASSPGARVRLDAADTDRLGVSIERLRVTVDRPAPLAQQAESLSRALRDLGGRLRAVEIDERLGGGSLRTASEEMRRGRFFQVELDGDGASIERYRIGDDGQRAREPFALTHEQIERVVDDLVEGLTARTP